MRIGRWLRTAALPARAHARLAPAAERLGTRLVRHPVPRRAMNEASEHLGPVFNVVFIGLFGGSRVTRPFVWRCRFGGAEFLIPVLPDMQRSWSGAWDWRWGGNASLRWFYEQWLERVAASPSTFLDVGANAGLHTYPVAAHGHRCVAFEPQPAGIDYIRRVIELNGFDAVEAVQTAVAAEEADAVPFHVSDATLYSSLSQTHVERHEPSERIDVPCTTIDAHCARAGLVPDLIKIDVEGAEWEVLQGAATVLAERRPTLLVEVSTDDAIKARCWELLTGLGYRAYYLDALVRRPFRAIASLDDFTAAAAERENGNFLFVQPETERSLGW